MKLSTVWARAICILLLASHVSFAQEITLTLKSKKIQHGTGVLLEIVLNAPSNLAPAGVQWAFYLPPGMQIAEIEEGRAAKRAGKTLVCNGVKCLIYGVNRLKIPNGQIAIAKITVGENSNETKDSAQYHPESRNRKQEIRIVDAAAASLEGKPMKVVSPNAASNSR